MKQWFGRTFHVIGVKPALLVPFLLVGITYFFILTLLYFAPQQPLEPLIGPPIIKFLGDRALRYPNNFTTLLRVLPKASLFVVGTLGILLTAYALWMLRSLFLGKPFRVLESIQISLQKYVPMLLTFSGIYLLIKFLSKVANANLALLFSGGGLFLLVSLVATFLFAALVQAIFFFVFPALMIGERSLIGAFRENFYLLQMHFFGVLFSVLVITFLGILPAVLKMLTPVLIRWTGGYEVVVLIASIGILMNVLTDILITLLSGVLYVELTGMSRMAREVK